MSQVLVDDRIAVRVYQTRGNHEPGREELGGKREWLIDSWDGCDGVNARGAGQTGCNVRAGNDYW